MPNKDEILRFSQTIEQLVSRTGLGYIEAIISHCNEIGLEVEVASALISQSLKAKIEVEALGLNLMKDKAARLPF